MKFLILLVTLISTTVSALEVTTQIHDIDQGEPHEDTLIFLTSGLIVTMKSHEKSLFNVLKLGLEEKTWFSISYNKEREILNARRVNAPIFSFKNHSKSFQRPLPDSKYNPSILKSIDDARSFFYDARTNPKESQCYNRAHAWTYDWRVKRQLYSSKSWIFFTKRFIRKYKFEWWFHVAPMVHVAINGEVKERILDMKYARGPLKLKDWTDIFIRDGAHCPVVNKYSDQANFPESGSCFVMKSSMYYYQPVDLEKFEITGIDKTSWIEQEVRHAFEEALDLTL